jgi:hypothetical protein
LWKKSIMVLYQIWWNKCAHGNDCFTVVETLNTFILLTATRRSTIQGGCTFTFSW